MGLNEDLNWRKKPGFCAIIIGFGVAFLTLVVKFLTNNPISEMDFVVNAVASMVGFYIAFKLLGKFTNFGKEKK